MIRLRQVKVDVLKDTKEEILRKATKKLNINKDDIKDFKIIKKSLDARKKDKLFFVYELDISTRNDEKIVAEINSKDVFISNDQPYIFEKIGTKELNNRPIIVGSGPAGLFCAYLLAENNYKPIIIERGEKVEDRIKTVEKFWNSNELNEESNVSFGEGGAGTFSDGKLNTLIKDKEKRGHKAFQIFVDTGANAEILYEQKPHIGTDNLRKIVKNIRNKIISMGGEFLYNTKLTDIEIGNGKITAIKVNNNKIIKTDILVLAIGHSARDTFRMLYKKGLTIINKPFAIGVRVANKQSMINESQYKKFAKYLPPASYKLTYQTKAKRGVYSFCMCPGGYVVNASSEKNRLVVNGMSNYERETPIANSAIVVTISESDYGTSPLAGIKYQEKLEEKAYIAGKGQIPIQLYKDFKEEKKTTNIDENNLAIKGSYTLSDLNCFLPKYISDSIKEAMPFFGTKIKGFDGDDTIMLGLESRTSSPVRIVRDENYVSNIIGIYPCGEGAGYAGGITSSAIDGIKVAEAIARIYKEGK